MKIAFLLSVLFLVPGKVPAQKVVIALTKHNQLYCGVSSPLSILVENQSHRLVLLTTNNGIVAETRDGFVCRPVRIGMVAFTIWLKQHHHTRKKVAVKKFVVKQLPPPVAYVCKKDSISKEVLLAINSLKLVQPYWDFDAPIQISRYTLIAFRGEAILFRIDNTGAAFTNATQIALMQLRKDDQLLIFQVQFETPVTSMEKEVAPLVLTLTDSTYATQ